jgi:hypothetical protein
MFAIAAYSIPESVNDRIGGWAETLHISKAAATDGLWKLRWKITGPYVLRTSQWQQWNMFSPDPIRIVLTMQIEQKIGTSWRVIRIVNSKRTPWWNYAREVKILYTIGVDDRYKPARQALLASECVSQNLPPRAKIRLVLQKYILPYQETVLPAEYWKTFVPEISREVDSEFICPATL